MVEFKCSPPLVGLKNVTLTPAGRKAKKGQTLPIAAFRPLKWYLESLVWEHGHGATTTVELAIDFWLATRIQLGSGATVMDLTRGFSTGATKTATLCRGHIMPAQCKFLKECGVLSRLNYRASQGYTGRARLFFPQEVHIILAAHQVRVGAARAKDSRGKQWKWELTETGCPLPEPRWRADPTGREGGASGEGGNGPQAGAVSAKRRGRPPGCKTGRVQVADAECKEVLAACRGRARPKRPRPEEEIGVQRRKLLAEAATAKSRRKAELRTLDREGRSVVRPEKEGAAAGSKRSLAAGSGREGSGLRPGTNNDEGRKPRKRRRRVRCPDDSEEEESEGREGRVKEEQVHLEASSSTARPPGRPPGPRTEGG